MTSFKFILAGIAVLLISGCTGDEPDTAATEASSTSMTDTSAASDTAAVETPLESGIDTQYIDEAVDPGDDFYRYVNGVWLETTEIPSDKSNYGAFSALADAAEENLRTIIEEAAAADAPAGSDAQKVGDFFASFMNEEQVEELGNTPLQATLADIGAAASKDDMLVKMAELNHISVQTSGASGCRTGTGTCPKMMRRIRKHAMRIRVISQTSWNWRIMPALRKPPHQCLRLSF